MFATTFIGKGARVGPYVGDIVNKDDMGGLHKSVNVGEVRNGVFLFMKSNKLYVFMRVEK